MGKTASVLSSEVQRKERPSPLAPRPSPDEQSEVAVLVPAAGQGTRLGGGTRKQFRTLGGAVLLVQTLRAFERHPSVDALVVAVPAERVEETTSALRAEGLAKLAAVVAGGATRQASVEAALQAAPPDAGLLLVHDAVRPFVPARCITAVIEAARAKGAAALALSVVDTVRRGADGVFGETVPRAGLYRMQTPQGFRRDWLEAAHASAAASSGSPAATDDVALVQRLGRPVQIVEGDPRNLKITTSADWALAQQRWGSWSQSLDFSAC